MSMYYEVLCVVEETDEVRRETDAYQAHNGS